MKVLVADPVAPEGVEILKKHADVDVKTGLKPEELAAIIGEYEGLMVRSETRVTAKIIEAGHKLQVIARAGVGIDNIDVEAATQRGIVVVNAPTANTMAAAEHTIALMMALARNIPQAHESLREGAWKRQNFVGVEVRNKTLGIVGLGNVGSEVARRVQGFHMRVLGFDPYVSPQYARNLHVDLVTLEEIFKEADFITLHVPLTPQSRNMIGPRELAIMKPTVRIINCARGGLIDEKALDQALREGRVAGAALDVFAQEPPRDCPLLKNDKVIVTPHLGASTHEAQANVAIDAAEQIISVLNGQPVRYAVNAPLISAEMMPILAPFLKVATAVGRMIAQLAEGQMSSIDIGYEGEVAKYDVTALKAAVIGGLLQEISEERINVVNANLVAKRRGLRVAEHKDSACENYASLITAAVTTTAGVTTSAGTMMRGELHIVRVNDYWIDIVPKGDYFLFSDHRDRPGLIGAVGNVTGSADINVSSMQLARLKPRGQALMVLELDEPMNEAQIKQILAIPDVYSAKLVEL
jgi:D-3-phosphoglycerate dehydrogenase / 2-oxoglutarate reductase